MSSSTQDQKPGRWKAFTSLDWYDGTIEFLFRFVAKTSEPLLAAGIVYSAADVLSKGHLGSTSPTMDNLWAISQALAIESSGGVVLVYGLQSLKEKDRVKACLYLILSALLAITGGVMLYMQLAGLENQQADSPLMRGLFALRCVVSVGYIYLCRTKAISFRNLDHEKATAPLPPAPPVPAPPATPATAQESAPAQIDYKQLAQELAPLLQAVRTTIIEEVKASIAGPETPRIPERRGNQKQNLLLLDTGKAEQPAPRIDDRTTTEKLEVVYQQLLQTNGGRYISARALAQEVHIHRRVCSEWLRTMHPENILAGATTTSKVEPEPESVATTGKVELKPVSKSIVTIGKVEPKPELLATGEAELKPPVITNKAEPEQEPLVTTSEGEPASVATTSKVQPEQEPPTESESAATASEAKPELTSTISEAESEPLITTSETEPAPVAIMSEMEPEPELSKPTNEGEPIVIINDIEAEPPVLTSKAEAEPEPPTTVNEVEPPAKKPQKKIGAERTRKVARPRPESRVTRPTSKKINASK